MWEGMPLTPTFNAMESVLASVVRRGADCARPAGVAGSAPPQGWRAGVDVRAQGRIMANDRNSASAPGYAVVGAWLGWTHSRGPWTVEAFARADNLTDRRHAGYGRRVGPP